MRPFHEGLYVHTVAVIPPIIAYRLASIKLLQTWMVVEEARPSGLQSRSDETVEEWRFKITRRGLLTTVITTLLILDAGGNLYSSAILTGVFDSILAILFLPPAFMATEIVIGEFIGLYSRILTWNNDGSAVIKFRIHAPQSYLRLSNLSPLSALCASVGSTLALTTGAFYFRSRFFIVALWCITLYYHISLALPSSPTTGTFSGTRGAAIFVIESFAFFWAFYIFAGTIVLFYWFFVVYEPDGEKGRFGGGPWNTLWDSLNSGHQLLWPALISATCADIPIVALRFDYSRFKLKAGEVLPHHSGHHMPPDGLKKELGEEGDPEVAFLSSRGVAKDFISRRLPSFQQPYHYASLVSLVLAGITMHWIFLLYPRFWTDEDSNDLVVPEGHDAQTNLFLFAVLYSLWCPVILTTAMMGFDRLHKKETRQANWDYTEEWKRSEFASDIEVGWMEEIRVPEQIECLDGPGSTVSGAALSEELPTHEARFFGYMEQEPLQARFPSELGRLRAFDKLRFRRIQRYATCGQSAHSTGSSIDLTDINLGVCEAYVFDNAVILLDGLCGTARPSLIARINIRDLTALVASKGVAKLTISSVAAMVPTTSQSKAAPHGSANQLSMLPVDFELVFESLIALDAWRSVIRYLRGKFEAMDDLEERIADWSMDTSESFLSATLSPTGSFLPLTLKSDIKNDLGFPQFYGRHAVSNGLFASDLYVYVFTNGLLFVNSTAEAEQSRWRVDLAQLAETVPSFIRRVGNSVGRWVWGWFRDFGSIAAARALLFGDEQISTSRRLPPGSCPLTLDGRILTGAIQSVSRSFAPASIGEGPICAIDIAVSGSLRNGSAEGECVTISILFKDWNERERWMVVLEEQLTSANRA